MHPYHNPNWDHLPESVKETLSNGSGEDTTTYYEVPYSGQVTDAGGGYYDDDRGRVHVYRFSADRAYNLQRDLVHANVPGTAFDIFTSEIISDTMDNSIEITTKNIPIIGMAFGAIDSVQSSTVIAIYDQIWELNKDKKTGAFQSLAVVLIERPCQPNGAGGCATNFSAVAFVIDSKGNVSDAVSFSFVSWGKIKGVLDNGLTSGDGG